MHSNVGNPGGPLRNDDIRSVLARLKASEGMVKDEFVLQAIRDAIISLEAWNRSYDYRRDPTNQPENIR